MGFVLGKQLTKEVGEPHIVGGQACVTGLAMAFMAGISIYFRNDVSPALRAYLNWPTFFPASTSFILSMVALCYLSLWFLNRRLDRRSTVSKNAVITFFKRYSSFSLTTYVLHFAIHIWPLYVIALWQGQDDPTFYMSNVVSSPIALLLAIIFIAIFYRVLVLWERRRNYTVEGLLRWLSDP
jgi:hypothetical protein